ERVAGAVAAGEDDRAAAESNAGEDRVGADGEEHVVAAGERVAHPRLMGPARRPVIPALQLTELLAGDVDDLGHAAALRFGGGTRRSRSGSGESESNGEG